MGVVLSRLQRDAAGDACVQSGGCEVFLQEQCKQVVFALWRVRCTKQPVCFTVMLTNILEIVALRYVHQESSNLFKMWILLTKE